MKLNDLMEKKYVCMYTFDFEYLFKVVAVYFIVFVKCVEHCFAHTAKDRYVVQIAPETFDSFDNIYFIVRPPRES